MKLNMKKLVIALGLAGLASTVLAVPIPLPGGLIQLSDNNAESLINGPDSIGATTLDVGDRLRGIFDINSIEGLNPASAAAFTPFNGNELTGLFDIVVLAKGGGPGAYTFTFGASGNLSTAGAAVEMYFDPTNDYTRLGCATTAICEATVTGGTAELWAAFGFGANSFWTASTVTDDITVLGAILPPTTGGTFNIGLEFLVNNTGYDYNKIECVFPGSGLINDVCASGSLLGKAGADSPYDSFSNVDFVLNRAVPEPASLALVGLALVGLGAARRRKMLAK